MCLRRTFPAAEQFVDILPDRLTWSLHLFSASSLDTRGCSARLASNASASGGWQLQGSLNLA